MSMSWKRPSGALGSSPRHHGVALAVYTVLALVLTWPLVQHMATRVPGDGIDDPALAWNLWWIRFRLVEQLQPDVFHADWMFYPIGVNLGFYTLTLLNGLLSIPLQVGLSLVLASNLVLLSAYVLAGYGTYLLVSQLLARAGSRSSHVHAVALVAGIVYAYGSPKLFYASLGQFNIASNQWVPFAVLYLLRAGASRRTRDLWMAGLFFGLQAWAELTYASFLVVFAGLYGVWILLGGEPLTFRGGWSWSRRGQAWLRLAGVGLVALVGLAPFLWAMVPDLRAEGDFFASGGGFADIFSADLAGYLVPTRLHPLWGDRVAGLPFPNDKGQHIYLGYTALLAAFLGALYLVRRWGRQGLFWPLAGLVFWWLTLGPNVRVMGTPTPIPGPFALLSRLPFFSGNRYPSRYSVMLLLCVAVLAAFGLHALLRSPRPRSLGPFRHARPMLLVFAFLFLFEHLAVPLPLNDFQVPEIYRRLAQEPGDFAVLELPTGWRNGARVLGRADVLIMMQQWYQTVHGKRRLGGNTSRNPAYKFQYFTQAPLLGDLIGVMNADRPHLAPVIQDQWDQLVARNRALAQEVLDFLDVRYVLLHVDRSPPALVRFVEEALPVTLEETWQGPDWTGAPSTIRLYRVLSEDPAGSSEPRVQELQPATELGRLYLAEGWSRFGLQGRVRYATRARPGLLLDLPAAGGTLTMTVYGPASLVDLRLNGVRLPWAAQAAQGDRQEIRAQIPPGVAVQPVDRLTLVFQDLRAHPTWMDAPTRGQAHPIGETGAALPPLHAIVAVSAGEEVGNFAHIYVTNEQMAGVDVALGQRGYNLVALDGQARVLDRVAFDTHGDPRASAALAEWIRRWPPGTIIAGAVQDEASFRLGEEAVQALQAIGVATDLRGRFRWSHAFVGVVGAAPGTAVEESALLRPADAVVGLPIDSPAITGGIGRVRFEARPSADPP